MKYKWPNVTCPRCGAGPGWPCSGKRGRVRISRHLERLAIDPDYIKALKTVSRTRAAHE